MTGNMMRASGWLVVIGGLAWAAGMLIAGPLGDGDLVVPELAGSLVWQVGMLAYLAVVVATRATGTGRIGRALPAVGITLVLLALLWTIGAIFVPERVDDGVMVALDFTWPLSMLWLLGVAIAVARVGRWKGRARWAPLVSKLYVAVALVGLAVLPEWPAVVVQALAIASLTGWLGWSIVRDVATGDAVHVTEGGAAPVTVS